MSEQAAGGRERAVQATGRGREGNKGDWWGRERAAWGLESKEGGRRTEGRAGQRAYVLCITVTCLTAVGRGRKRQCR